MIVWETIKAHFRVHAKAAPKRHVLHTSHTYSHPFIIFALLRQYFSLKKKRSKIYRKVQKRNDWRVRQFFSKTNTKTKQRVVETC